MARCCCAYAGTLPAYLNLANDEIVIDARAGSLLERFDATTIRLLREQFRMAYLSSTLTRTRWRTHSPYGGHLEYWIGGWKPVLGERYTSATTSFPDVRFSTITTRCLRAVFDASSAQGTYAGVGVQELVALTPMAVAPLQHRDRGVPPCND